MPLTMASIGETNTIRKVGGNEETKRFLENLGFVAGAEITDSAAPIKYRICCNVIEALLCG